MQSQQDSAPLPKQGRLAYALGSRENSFDLLRLLAASGVVLSHAVPLTQGDNTNELLHVLSQGQVTLGQVCVAVFFVISGALITQSAERTRSATRFLSGRLLRIFPGLVVALGVTVLVIGPLLTPDSLASYFSRRSTYTYVPINTTLWFMQLSLGHLFEDNPYPKVVNGSLWSLEYEFGFYLVVLGLARCRLCRPGVIVALWGAAALIVGGRASAALNSGEQWAYLFLFFGSGMLLYLWRDRVVLSARAARICTGLIVITLGVGYGAPYALSTAGAYLLMFLAARRSATSHHQKADLSYGLYIYAFPVQQSVTAFIGPSCSWWLNVTIGYPIVVALAFASWYLVERPALALKSHPLFTGGGPGATRYRGAA